MPAVLFTERHWEQQRAMAAPAADALQARLQAHQIVYCPHLAHGIGIKNKQRTSQPVCNIYSLNKNRESIAKMFKVGHNRSIDISRLPGVFPNYNAPVIRMAADGEREMVNLNWGFVLPQPGKAPRRVTNVRDDKARTGFWRESMGTAPLPGAGVSLLRTQRR